MRIRIPLLGYAAACITGPLVFSLFIIGNDPYGGLELAFGIGFVGMLVGSIIALPVALPLILFTEKWGKGPCWVFAGGGFFAGAAPLLLLAGEANNPDILFLSMLVFSTTLSGIVYWLVAWQIYPLHPEIEEEVEVFQ